MGKEEGERLNIDFGESPKVLRDQYMDVYEKIYAEVVTTTYLGKIGMRREDIMKAEGKFSPFQSKVCHGNNIEWRGMSDIIGYGSK